VCRWLAYTGSSLRLSTVLLRPTHSLIDQSLRSDFGAETTNGDGFGVGWYDDEPTPGVFRSIEPASEREIFHQVSDDARLVVSEPIGGLPGAWHEVPEASYGVIGRGHDELLSFSVKPPPTPVAISA
jgi:hypothetical protein